MTDSSLSLTLQRTFAHLIQPVLDAVDSPHTRRAYARALTDFLTWYDQNNRPKLSKSVVQRYAAELKDGGSGPSTVNQRLSAIRKFIQEAADNGLLTEAQALSITRVKGMRKEGRRSGNWLSRTQAQRLINAPDSDTLKGLRDRAILSVLVGCGLRREEAAGLTFEHVQQRDGRWAIVDLVGKRTKIRTVAMPPFCKSAIDAWAGAARLSTGRVFRSMHRSGRIDGDSMTAQAIHDVVKEYAALVEISIAPHDLRRTYAKLAHKGGAALEQIQLSLGHASIRTTEQYLGVEQDLTDAPCDHLGLSIAR